MLIKATVKPECARNVFPKLQTLHKLWTKWLLSNTRDIFSDIWEVKWSPQKYKWQQERSSACLTEDVQLHLTGTKGPLSLTPGYIHWIIQVMCQLFSQLYSRSLLYYQCNHCNPRRMPFLLALSQRKGVEINLLLSIPLQWVSILIPDCTNAAKDCPSPSINIDPIKNSCDLWNLESSVPPEISI